MGQFCFGMFYDLNPQMCLPSPISPSKRIRTKMNKVMSTTNSRDCLFLTAMTAAFSSNQKEETIKGRQRFVDVYLLLTSPPCAFNKGIATSSLSERWLFYKTRLRLRIILCC